MTRYIYILLLVLAFASCRDREDLEKFYFPPETTAQKAFAEEFTAIYGEVSKQITWQTASNIRVTVNLTNLAVGEKYNVQFLTADPRKHPELCYLLSEYQNLAGGSLVDLSFDCPDGLNQVYVSAVSLSDITYIEYLDISEAGISKGVVFDSSIAEAKRYAHQSMHYRMCFEGFTGEDKLDFDYNDVVIDVEYVRGRSIVSVSLLAAGCDCGVQLALRRSGTLEKGEDEILFDEVHAALGYEGQYNTYYGHDMYLELNTGLNTTDVKATTAFALSEDAIGSSITKLSTWFFAYFKLPPLKKNGNETITESFLPNKPGIAYPQALLIADPNWQWPPEGMIISATHSQFRFWIADPDAYPLWYGGKMWISANSVASE